MNYDTIYIINEISKQWAGDFIDKNRIFNKRSTYSKVYSR